MYPIIMDDTKKLSVLFQDSSNGLGRLTDATAVKVTEEINGQFTAEITYPVTGAHFSDIHDSGILKIKVAPGKPAQLFRISSIKKKSKNTATISLNHISYDLSKVAVTPFTATLPNSGLLQSPALPAHIWQDKRGQFWMYSGESTNSTMK